MPYSIVKRGSKWAVIKKDTGEVIGTHDSKQKAAKQIVAIHINEHK